MTPDQTEIVTLRAKTVQLEMALNRCQESLEKAVEYGKLATGEIEFIKDEVTRLQLENGVLRNALKKCKESQL